MDDVNNFNLYILILQHEYLLINRYLLTTSILNKLMLKFLIFSYHLYVYSCNVTFKHLIQNVLLCGQKST